MRVECLAREHNILTPASARTRTAPCLTDNGFLSRRFVYKFVCDLKNLLGYSAGELSKLVLEAEDAASDAPEPGTNGGH